MYITYQNILVNAIITVAIGMNVLALLPGLRLLRTRPA